VLDVACGNGNASLAAARRWCKVTGLDYNLLIDGIGSLREEATPGQGEDGGSPPVEIKKPRLYSQLFWVLGLALGILALGGTMLYRRGAA